MAVSNELTSKLVDELLKAEREVREIIKLTERLPLLSIEEAYDLQKQVIQHKIHHGEKRIGVKLGLTSKAKQEMMGVHEAIYGYLLSGMLAYEWEPLVHNKLIHPKAEPEIAFLLEKDLMGHHVTGDDVVDAAKYVCPALEVIDSRYLNFNFTMVDVVADNCSSSYFVLGSDWVKPREVDLAAIGMVMNKNGEVAATGSGAAVLGNPAEAVAWAVRKLAERGEGLYKGDIVLSGALSEAIAFEAGDTVIAQFEGFGSVSLFSK